MVVIILLILSIKWLNIMYPAQFKENHVDMAPSN